MGWDVKAYNDTHHHHHYLSDKMASYWNHCGLVTDTKIGLMTINVRFYFPVILLFPLFPV